MPVTRRRRTAPRRNGVTGLSASVERDDLSGGWAVYIHDGRRTLNMTDDYFASKAGAEREAKKMLAQARAGVPLDTLAAMFYEAHVAPSRRAERELANPRRRRTAARRRNPYAIPSHVVPKDAKKGDRVVFVEGRTVYFGFADADGSGNFEFRVAYGKTAKAYSTPGGAERAVAKWLTTGK